MAVTVDGELGPGVTAKDLVLSLISQVGTGAGIGHVVSIAARPSRHCRWEGRMTIANMSIEWGAKAGMIAPDDTTFSYVEGRQYAPTGKDWEAALDYWRSLPTDADATFDAEVHIDAPSLRPFVTWGTNPGQGVSLDGVVPDPSSFGDVGSRTAAERALAYMALEPGTRMYDVPVDVVFLGSCNQWTARGSARRRGCVAGSPGRPVGTHARRTGVGRRTSAGGGPKDCTRCSRTRVRSGGFAGCSMCPRDEPGHARAGSAVGLHVEPQLSRVGRAAAVVRISCRPPSPPRPRGRRPLRRPG